jgi:glycerol uptake facilitator-like aquaporin
LVELVVWETAVSPKSTAGINAPIAIGFTVFLAHILLTPIDGCGINPTRSFGPMVVAPMRNCPDFFPGAATDYWVFWLAPHMGAVAATLFNLFFFDRKNPALAEM